MIVAMLQREVKPLLLQMEVFQYLRIFQQRYQFLARKIYRPCFLPLPITVEEDRMQLPSRL